MADTNFIDKQTVITAAWAQDVNNAVYRNTFPTTPTLTANLTASSTAITATTGTNTTAIATTAFTQQELNNTIVKQIDNAFTTTGTSGVYTLTPTIALPALIANTRYRIKFHLASTPGTGSTLQISALTPQSVFQYDPNGNKVNPTIATGMLTDVEWDGSSFVIIDPLPTPTPAVVGATPIRQTVLSGVTDANGRSSFITGGAGLAASLSATAAPLTMAFANGFGAGGQTDFIERITVDNSTYWTNLGASNMNYLFANRIGSGNVVGGSALAPVQYGYSYDQTKQSLLHFDGAAGSTTILDDYGNSWTAQSGAKLQTNSVKFGTAGLGGNGTNNALNGSSDFIKNTSIASLPRTGWAMRGWFNASALPGSGATVCLASVGNVAGFGAVLQIYNNTGTIKFSYALSSNGTSFDIASGVQGVTTPVVGTYYFVELTHDAVAGIYRLYVNGTQEASTTNANFVNQTSATGSLTTIGANTNSTPAAFFNGYVDEFELIPYCDHSNAVAYSVPLGAKSISTAGYSSDWFDISTYTMKSPSVASGVSGSNPTFTISNKLYVGEATTNATTVTNAISYAFQGRFQGTTAVPANGTVTTFTDNTGYLGARVQAVLKLINIIPDNGYNVGDVISFATTYLSTGPLISAATPWKQTRNITKYSPAATNNALIVKADSSGVAGITLANWNYLLEVTRNF